MTHSPLVERIDTVRAYHTGPRLLLEVDIVMDRNERLEIVHDVAEDLQTKLERLPCVERAFVHIDYETSHKPVGGPPFVVFLWVFAGCLLTSCFRSTI
ncbi:hypothetical protein IMZ48_41145 [Candidatus Bathyarchaeota archaeon]|nr:hypothetical protein [Candidatus Bathyarchaeota archaeon]